MWVAERSLLVNGQKQPYLRNSNFEASRAAKILRERMPQLPPAQAVLALVSPAQIKIKKRPDDVSVLDPNSLKRWLLKRPVVLAEAELVKLFPIIDALTTWPLTIFQLLQG